MTAYYNENDPRAAAWLRELIARNLIAPGDVDERSIIAVQPADLVGYTQHHFFAGIGVWSHALRRAGWPDDRPVWTGSCPCQPFSAAGKGEGVADARHLWPEWFRLVSACQPDVVFGEQVASSATIGSAGVQGVRKRKAVRDIQASHSRRSAVDLSIRPDRDATDGKDGKVWLDAVFDDLEAAHYTCGAVVFPACGVGAPHLRQRLYWVANANNPRPQGRGLLGADRSGDGAGERPLGPDSNSRGLGDPALRNANEHALLREGSQGPTQTTGRSETGGVALATDERDESRRRAGDVGRPPEDQQGETRERERGGDAVADTGVDGRPGPTNGLWRPADWLRCRDGKWRPVEPGTFPLAHGAAARVGRLRGYGNGLCGPQAEAVIRAYLDIGQEDGR